MKHMRTSLLNLRTGSILALSAVLTACVAPPPQRTVVQAQPVPPPIMVYPAKGQTPEQLDRDRYECHVWAVQQSGFDPSRPDVPAGERVVVEPANPPGAGTAVGAIAGAILGRPSPARAMRVPAWFWRHYRRRGGLRQRRQRPGAGQLRAGTHRSQLRRDAARLSQLPARDQCLSGCARLHHGLIRI